MNLPCTELNCGNIECLLGAEADDEGCPMSCKCKKSRLLGDKMLTGEQVVAKC